MPSRRTTLALLAVLSLAPAATFADGDPVTALNIAPGAKVNIGQKLVVKMKGPKSADLLRCQINQGNLDYGWSIVDKNGECVITKLAEPGTNYRAGAAVLTLEAIHDHDHVGDAAIPIEIVAAAPKGGAGTKYDGGYWMNKGGGQGSFQVKDVVIKNGILSMRIMIEDAITFQPVTGFVVNGDGTIVRQTRPLGAWAAVPGAEMYDDYKKEADRTKSVTVDGHFDTRSAGRALELRVETAKMDGEDEPNYKEGTFYPNGNKGEEMTFSGKSAGSGGAKGGGGKDACKKACFHTEATCSGNRGACMKARQQCVSGC